MVILTAQDLCKRYGDRTLFEGIEAGIKMGDKIGLIGANGAGKTTLLGILSGTIAPDEGRVATNNEARIEYLHQDPALRDELSAIEQVLVDGPRAFEVLSRYERALVALEQAPEDARAMERLAALSDEMDRVDAWGIEGEARTILGALGIKDHRAIVGQMSGGQRKRVALARALIRPSDLLILDEPTNHLDVRTIEWLEQRLITRRGALLMITHDRYFLDRVTNTIFELAEGTIHRHEGNYSVFLESRAARQEAQRAREQSRSQLAKQELDWLRRSPQARTTKNRARIARANDLLSQRFGPAETRDVEIDTVTSRLGKKVVQFERVTKRFGDLVVLDDVSYLFTRRERVGIVGPNGAGKSTLLNLMAGRLKPDTGRVDVGETVVVGYYDQQSEQLDETQRVHDYIVERCGNEFSTSEGSASASQMLTRFLFDRSRQWDVIGKLSGGERRRLYLLKVLLGQPNVLLLDEPTNDLDVETLSVLEDYLDSFEGVLCVVSHDRYFLDRVAEHLLVLDGQGGVTEFPGDYTSWLEESAAIERASALEAQAERAAQQAARAEKERTKQKGAAEAAASKLSYKERREFEALGARIAQIEARVEALDAEMVTHHDDYEALQQMANEKGALEEEMESSLERWMELGERDEAS